jgi:hypothetical protein
MAQKDEIEKSIKKDMSTKIGRPVGTFVYIYMLYIYIHVCVNITYIYI